MDVVLEKKALDFAKKADSIEEAIQMYFMTSEFRVEYAVPCVSENCRKQFFDKEQAEQTAREEGTEVIEVRTVSPWRVIPDWPPAEAK